LLEGKFAKAASQQERSLIFRSVKQSMQHVNNWDLVDHCAPKIIGPFLREKGSYALLKQWARRRNLWYRRSAIMATFPFIREREFAPALEIAAILLEDSEDLVQKAVGWM